MHQYLFSFLLGVLLLTAISCNQDPCYTKQQFVESYSGFFDEFEKESEELDEVGIKAFEDRYIDLLENCYKKYKTEMSSDERKEFWRSSVGFYLDKEGGLFNIDFNDKSKDDPVKAYIVEELEEMADATTYDFNELMESVLEDELPRLIDSFVGKVEEIGNALKDSLQED